ncbi:MAG TPA: galactose oxidase-like domain-containing protein [Gemmatimonadales bacterium]|nr:galactose oxidase-like domain-containing protein [Gemmatimonadales bacterium]
MPTPRSLTISAALVAAGSALILLHACEDPARESDISAAAATATKVLTITGGGTGNGTVTSSPAGINCTITNGVAGATGCTAQFTSGVTVTLTAKAKSGSSFVGWLGDCTGLTACRPVMSQKRTVTARFLKGPFALKIAGGGSGTGSGRVRSQTGLSPAINCAITSGTAATTGCSASYPAGTVVTLTATPATGQSFAGWSTPCSGTGTCKLTVTQPWTIYAAFASAGSSAAAIQGKWGSPIATNILAVHAHVLPNGKVFFWGRMGEARLWDPAHPSAGFVDVTKLYQLYCTGHTFLPDGRLLIVGGAISTTGNPKGDSRGTIYNPATNTFTAATPMAQGRYYPTLTMLPNGQVLAFSGSDQTGAPVTIPEVGDGVTWRRLTGAPLSIPNPYYPAMFLAPNGKVFLAGFPATSRYLSTAGTGSWATVATRKVADRTMGSAVMYAPGKILYVGGGDPPTNSAEVIDLNQAAPSWRLVSPMRFPRRQTNTTLLADGSVLVTNGSSGPGFNDFTSPVFDAELWKPASGVWSLMARENAGRTYHSTTLLLPDARVLSGGSGEGGGVDYANSQLTLQVFAPPYLYNADGSLATRPAITSAPTRLTYGLHFTVQSPNAASITKGTLIRLSSVTHAFNQSQLIYPLTFSASGSGAVAATAPPNANIAPPGPYMLFVLNSKGVPSKAWMVSVGP